MNTIRATMTTAAIATMETVDTATITVSFLSYGLRSGNPNVPELASMPRHAVHDPGKLRDMSSTGYARPIVDRP